MTKTKKEWFCRICWRSGDFDFADPTMEGAKLMHDWMVATDKKAMRIPAGMNQLARDSAIMEKFHGSDCAGDLRIRDFMEASRQRNPEQLKLTGTDN